MFSIIQDSHLCDPTTENHWIINHYCMFIQYNYSVNYKIYITLFIVTTGCAKCYVKPYRVLHVVEMCSDIGCT